MIARNTFRSFHLVIGRNFLPGKQETNEVGARDRLDLLSQTIQRVAMNSSEQTAGAPLSFGRAGCELAADNKTFCFELQ